MDVAHSDGLLLVIGGGVRVYREYLLASLARRRAWLLDEAPAAWQLGYLAGSTAVPRIRAVRLTSNLDALAEQVDRIAAKHPVTGLLTYEETLVVPTARLAERLNLPGLSVLGAQNCRDKQRSRTALTDAGLRQPAFSFVNDGMEALLAADRIGYPVVVKPRGMGGSVGVVRADGPSTVLAAFAAADGASRYGNSAYSGGALVEELLDGPEISIDGAVHDGDYRPIFVARKTVGLEPFFEERGHIVDAADPLLDDGDLQTMLQTAHTALGVRDGVTHTEVKLTGRGPAIVEVNGRLGGDLIPLLGRLATGVDPADIAADIATGTAPRWRVRRRGSVGIRFCYPPTDGVVRGVRLPRPGNVPGLLRADRLAPDGAVLGLPPRAYLSRYALVVCEAPDPARCAGVLREAVSRVSLDLEPT
ncbi:MAG: hypothetical protein QOI74_3950 [Micromonosporaceae bacterium]|nr:hypothetical protein [Micromonosporaceae bacterium]